MIIGLNLSTLRGHGSSRIGQGVLKGLQHVGGHHRFVAWIPESWRLENSGDIPLHRCKGGIAAKFYTEQIHIRHACQSGNVKHLLSFTDTSIVACPVPHVLMIQNSFLAYPTSEWPTQCTFQFRARMTAINALFALTKPTVKFFSVQTESMKERLSKKWRIQSDKIIVVPSAVVINGAQDPIIEHRTTKPYICVVATPSPQKQYHLLPSILHDLKRGGREIECRITVLPSDVPELVQQAQHLGVLRLFKFLGNTTTTETVDLISHATAMLMPSVLESFGLPYYEALALGCPVVAADRDFAREALGGAGLYASAGSSAEFAIQLSILIGSESTRASHSQAGITRYGAMKLTWNEIALKYLQIMDRL